MKKILLLLSLILNFTQNSFGNELEGNQILQKIDSNQYLNSAKMETRMVIYGRSGVRSISSRSWVSGKDKSFSEYLSPAREKGKKMLKVKDKLWTYTPEPEDRIIVISGHLLKQSVAGSDLSYEDHMGNDSMVEDYNTVIIGEEKIGEFNCKILELTAKRSDVNYYKRKIWVDTSKWLPIKTDLMAKSGKTLKRMEIKEIMKVENRWYPKKMFFKDLLSTGKGTEYYIDSISFNENITESRFTKAYLRK